MAPGTGTTVHFKPDPKIFSVLEYSGGLLKMPASARLPQWRHRDLADR